jgi:DNA-binding winged helix-turn-helix (wHTH) protein
MQWRGLQRPFSYAFEVYPFYRKALMQRGDQSAKPPLIANGRNSRRGVVKPDSYHEPAPRRQDPLPRPLNRSATDEAALEFGRFRVLLRQRQLFAEGVPVELGTRAFDILLVLLEADGSLVTKDELMRRVWPGIVVADENLKVQIATLRKALAADRDVIYTEYGRGYRFTGEIRMTAAPEARSRQVRTRQRDGFTVPLRPQHRPQSFRCRFS